MFRPASSFSGTVLLSALITLACHLKCAASIQAWPTWVRRVKKWQSSSNEVSVIAFSDIHGRVPKGPDGDTNLNDFKLSEPGKKITDHKADVLIYGGDMSLVPFGDAKEIKGEACQPKNADDIRAFIKWFAGLTQYPVKVLISGNHEVCMDPRMIGEGDGSVRAEMLEYMRDNGITYLEGECKALKVPGKGVVHVLGSPLSEGRAPPRKPGAFQYSPPVDGETVQDYSAIVDKLKKAAAFCPHPIVVMHGTPDNVNFQPFDGYKEPVRIIKPLLLVDAIVGMEPEIVLAGHFHGAGKAGYVERDTYLEATQGGGRARLLMTAMKTVIPEDREPNGVFTVDPVEFTVPIRTTSMQLPPPSRLPPPEAS